MVFGIKEAAQVEYSQQCTCMSTKFSHQFRAGRCLIFCGYAAGFSSVLLADSRVCTPQACRVSLSSMVLDKWKSQATPKALCVRGSGRNKLCRSFRTTCKAKSASLTGIRCSHDVASAVTLRAGRTKATQANTSCNTASQSTLHLT